MLKQSSSIMLQDALDKRLKCIFVARNPKDVAVSFFNHSRNLSMYQYTGKFENYLQMFMRGESRCMPFILLFMRKCML